MRPQRIYTRLGTLAAAAVVLSTTLLVGSAWAVETFGSDGPSASAEPKPAFETFSQSLDLAITGTIPAVTLGPLDVNALLEEDRSSADLDKRMRTGISRDATVRLTDGRWVAAPGRGWLWVADVVAQGAVAVRLHFDLAQLPAGAQAIVYSPGFPEAISGPYEGRGPLGDGQFWSRPLPGERVRIEYFVPGESAVAPQGRPFLVDQIVHVYQDPLAAPTPRVEEGPCHNDVTCFPAWANVARAVGRIDFVSGGSSFLCSGQLMMTVASDFTPYFLTASHCIDTNAEAQSAVIFWLFQTATCGGAPPGIGTVPSSSVCTLLSNASGPDYSLLMVDGTLPSGLNWSGWTTGGVANGTATAAIHHPGGAFKRITFGNKASNTTCGSSTNHIRMNWTSGVTEGGSSGSGVFTVSGQQLIGQLHCGPSICGGASLNDDYGDFAVSYPSIAGLLNAGSDDYLEENDVCAAPAAPTPGYYAGLVVKSVDEDWYRVTLARNATLDVTIFFTHAFGDVDMSLWDGCGGPRVAVSQGIVNNEHFAFTNAGPSRDFYLRVYLFSDTRNKYDLSFTVGGNYNLNATTTPPGFSSPVVPRNLNDAGGNNAILTPTLDGNVFSTWMNWATQQEGPANMPSWTTDLLLDGAWITGGFVGDDNGPGSYQAINWGPFSVRGGRHTLTSVADAANTAPETNEFDNQWSGQWVWSPLVTSWASPVLRSVPPSWGFFANPNGDGFSFTRHSSYAWVIGIAGQNPGDDDDLRVYSDYAGSSSGFSTLVGSSSLITNYTDFVVGHYSGTPVTMYPQAHLYSTAGGGGLFGVDQIDARFRNGQQDAVWTGQFMDANRLVDVYEANLVAGTTYYFTLRRTSGDSDLLFEIFPGTIAGIYGRGAGIGSFFYTPSIDYQAFTASVSGWHPIVVYRNDGTAAGPLTYDLSWSRSGFVDVPDDQPENASLAFLGAAPNPISTRGRLEFVLPQAGNVRLSVFDLNGRRVAMLADRSFGAGRHSVDWDGTGESGARLGAGVYWARLEAGGRTFTRRMSLLH